MLNFTINILFTLKHVEMWRITVVQNFLPEKCWGEVLRVATFEILLLHYHQWGEAMKVEKMKKWIHYLIMLSMLLTLSKKTCPTCSYTDTGASSARSPVWVNTCTQPHWSQWAHPWSSLQGWGHNLPMSIWMETLLPTQLLKKANNWQYIECQYFC